MRRASARRARQGVAVHVSLSLREAAAPDYPLGNDMALLDFIATAIHAWEGDDSGQPTRVEEPRTYELPGPEQRPDLISQTLNEAVAPQFLPRFEAAASSRSQW